MKGFINTAVAIAAVFSIAGGLLFAYAYRQPDIKVGAPSTALTYQATLLPLKGSAYDLGTSSDTWRNLFIDQVCLTSDSCRTTWPSGSGGGGVGFGTTSADYWITATSTLPSLTTLVNLGTVKTSLTGILKAASGVLSVATAGSDYLATVAADAPLSGSGTSASHLVLSTSGTWSGNAGTATALAANGTNCNAGSYPLGVDASGNSENCTATFAWPWVTTSVFGTTTRATTTPEWFQTGFFASSTSYLSTVSALTSTTTNASTTALSATTFAAGGTATTSISIAGVLTTPTASALLLAASTGAVGAYGGSANCTNQVLNGISALGAGNCVTVANAMLANSSVTYTAGSGLSGGGAATLGGGAVTLTANPWFTPDNNFGALANATNTAVWFKQGISASSTSYFNVASTTQLFGADLTSCQGGNVLTWSAGLFGCAADQTTSGASAFTFASTYATTAAATTSPLWLQGNASSLFSSSTAYFGSGGVGTSSVAFGSSPNEWLVGSYGVDNTFRIAATPPGTGFFSGTALTINKSTLNVAMTYSTSTHQTVTTNEWLTNTPSAALSTDASGLVIASTTGLVTATSPITLDNSTRRVFGGGVQISCASCALFGYDFTPATNYAVNTNSTTTPLWLKGTVAGIYSFMASNTAAFDQIKVGSSTISTQATSTFFGNLETFGNASSTNVFAQYASTTNLTISGVRGALLLNGATGVVGAYGGSANCTNQVVNGISATGVGNCVSVANAMLSNSTLTVTAGSGLSGGGSVALGASITLTGNPWFTPGSNYGQVANSTTTEVYFNASPVSLSASSTAYFNTINALTSTTTEASTTDISARTLAVGGTATTTIDAAGLVRAKNLTLFSITGTAANCLSADTNGAVSGTGNACGSGAGGAGIADPFLHQANFGTGLASATTTPLWAQNYLFASSTAYLTTALLASSTAPQLYLSDTFAPSMFAFREISGNLFIATSTSTVVPFATSTNPILTILGATGYWGIGTTSPWARFTVSRFPGTGSEASSSILITEFPIATTTNKTIDARDGNTQLFQIGTAATTINLTGFLAGSNLTLTVCNPGAATAVNTAGTITWATTPINLLLWANSTTSPTQTLTANKCDVWHFMGTAATTSNGISAAGIGLGKIFGWQLPNF